MYSTLTIKSNSAKYFSNATLSFLQSNLVGWMCRIGAPPTATTA